MAEPPRLALPLRPAKAQLTDAAWIADAHGRAVGYLPQSAGVEPGRVLAWREEILRAVNGREELLGSLERLESILSEPEAVAAWTNEQRDAVEEARRIIERERAA